jgi:hypothetical protein
MRHTTSWIPHTSLGIAPLALLTALTGCACGSFEAYLPDWDRDYSGHEVCGADNGSFGQVDYLQPNQFTLFVSPRVHGSAERREEMNTQHMVVYMRRDEMVEGAFPELNPWGDLSGGAAHSGEVEVLRFEETGSADELLHTARYRLRWDLTWGTDDGQSVYKHAEATDWVEAFL